jgi:FtsP/CotA-like multicopper oxidase with cupredoxin domain
MPFRASSKPSLPKPSLPFLSLTYPPDTFFYHAHQSMVDSEGTSDIIVINPDSSSTQPPNYDENRQVFLKNW